VYARVARWEGQDREVLREAMESVRRQAEAGERPPGVPLVAGTMLVDYDQGTSMAIMFFDTEDDLRQGDEAMNAMSPQFDTGGQRVSVELFEVAMDVPHRPSM
jgi:hypothetical protein